MEKEIDRLDIKLAKIAWNNAVVTQNIFLSNCDTLGEEETKKLLNQIHNSKRISDYLIGCNDRGYDNVPPQKKFNYN